MLIFYFNNLNTIIIRNQINPSTFRTKIGGLSMRLQTGALLLDGNTLNYFGKSIPINLVVAVIAEIVLVGGAEYYRIINGLVRTFFFLAFYISSLQLQATINAVSVAASTAFRQGSDDSFVGFGGQAAPRRSI